MYTDTREISANAVKAGQAYQNIVDAIEDANTAALESYDAADIAVVNVSTKRRLKSGELKIEKWWIEDWKVVNWRLKSGELSILQG